MTEGKERLGFRQSVDVMHRLLRGEISPEQGAETLGAPTERVAIYQQFVRLHVRNTLEKNYSILSQLLSGPTWDKLVEDYFSQFPPWDYELNANAERFRELLQQQAQGSGDVQPFHLELAELEWHEWLAFSAQQQIPHRQSLDAPTVNPTLTILEFAYPVSRFVDAWRAARDAGQELPRELPQVDSERVLLFRDPEDNLPVFYQADDGLLFAFKMAYEGTSIEDAAAVSGLPEDAVAKLLQQGARLGLILLPSATWASGTKQG